MVSVHSMTSALSRQMAHVDVAKTEVILKAVFSVYSLALASILSYANKSHCPGKTFDNIACLGVAVAETGFYALSILGGVLTAKSLVSMGYDTLRKA